MWALTIAGVLYMLYRGMSLPLEHYHYNVFSEKDIREDIFNITAPVSFKVGNDKVEELCVRFESMVPDIVFENINKPL